MNVTYEEALEVISRALRGNRKSPIPPNTDESYDAQWDEICSGMDKNSWRSSKPHFWKYCEDKSNDSPFSEEPVQSETTELTHKRTS